MKNNTIRSKKLAPIKPFFKTPVFGATLSSIKIIISNVVYYIECSVCNLVYIGQTSNTLNVKVNGYRSGIKNCKSKKVKDFEIKHFQLHIYNKINLYISEVVHNLESRLKMESLSMCILNTIYPYGLNYVFNGNIFNNIDNVSKISDIFIALQNQAINFFSNLVSSKFKKLT